MANERENNTNYTIYENGPLGEVQIANEVVAIIAGIAATEVDGGAALAGGGYSWHPARMTTTEKTTVLPEARRLSHP